MSGGMVAWPWQTVLCRDGDGDAVLDDIDNCPTVSNPTQDDADGDGVGDACEQMFRRGDFDSDMAVDIADAIRVLLFLFGGGMDPACPDAADADDSGTIEIADALRILGYLFLAQAPLSEPFSSCGPDPTQDALSCGADLPCR
jgi:hypothetical protein